MAKKRDGWLSREKVTKERDEWLRRGMSGSKRGMSCQEEG